MLVSDESRLEYNLNISRDYMFNSEDNGIGKQGARLFSKCHWNYLKTLWLSIMRVNQMTIILKIWGASG